MSFSFSAGGDIQTVRKQVAEVYEPVGASGHDIRAAKRSVGTEVDKLEIQGATHVTVTANGHGGSQSINVQRDSSAEATHKAAEFAKGKRAWEQSGRVNGYVDTGACAQACDQDSASPAKPKSSSSSSTA